MKKKLFSLGIACAVSVLALSGCKSKNAANENNIVNISILNSKTEINEVLEDVMNDFMQENKDIIIKLVKFSNTGNYADRLTGLIAVDNAPTLSLMDVADIKNYKDNFLSLSDEKWVDEVVGGISDIAKNDKGEVIAFPLSTEGTGIIYNKKVLSDAGVNPDIIKTIKDLEDAFKKVKASGKDAIIIANEDWALANHFLATAYAADIDDSSVDATAYFEGLKSSSDAIPANKKINGLIDVFDIMKKYNIYADKPFLPSYDTCSKLLGSGKVGFWYGGNWASGNILANSNGNSEFGFLPVPMSNNASDKMNRSIAIGITKYFSISSSASEKQIEAAKRFLDYLVYHKNGNKFLVEDCGMIPAFSNMEIPKTDPLVNEIVKYREADQTIELVNAYLPKNNQKELCGALRQYLNNEITREQLIRIIKNFWKNS